MNLLKKISIGFGIAASALSAATAQNTNSFGTDAQMPRWFIGGGIAAGTQLGSIEQTNWVQAYSNALNANVSSLSQKNASHLGLNFSLGYFFGKNRNFGLGTGIQYLGLRTTYGLDKFALEYQSTDNFGSTFRQGLRANQAIEEQIKQGVIGLPIMVMYKKQINQRWGLNLDAGVVINLSQSAKFSAEDAKFDYEAIYSFDANGNPVYDNSPTPRPK